MAERGDRGEGEEQGGRTLSYSESGSDSATDGADSARADKPGRRLALTATKTSDSAPPAFTLPQASPRERDDQRLERGALVHRYVIHDRVGEGGMGVVYAAYDPELDRKIALKFLRSGPQAYSDRRRSRLLREAQAMARLTHPNVAAVYDVGTFQGQVFIAMEFIAGTTLGDWLARHQGDWPAIRRVFTEAGRGLAAAHKAGIIHRDFKPDNVLLDADDHAKVTDFGLARALDDGHDDGENNYADLGGGSPGCGALATPLTHTGAFIGTPNYMSPEQHQGRRADDRSDQFSFSVALYEALYGELPFAGDSHAELTRAVLAGERKETPASAAPRWLQKIATRGLATKPDQRFASMSALLAALDSDPVRRRRWLALAAVVGVLVVGGIYIAASPSTPRKCQSATTKLDGVWDLDRRAAIERAFTATRRPYAADSYARVAGIIDDYAAAWLVMHQDACAATNLRNEQSPALLDLRMSCLDDRRLELGALTELFAAAPDVAVLDKAIDAAYGLPNLAACADVANLQALVPLPDAPELRARVDSLAGELRRADALTRAGKYQDARELVTTVTASLAELAYPPITARALDQLGLLETTLGDLKGGEKHFYAAAAAAANAGDRPREAQVWIRLLDNIGKEQARFGEIGVLRAAATAAIVRAGNQEELLARLHNVLGTIYFVQHQTAEAVAEFRIAIEMLERVHGERSPSLATSMANLGLTLTKMGRLAEAQTYVERALEIRQQVKGPDHPDVTLSLATLGELQFYPGNHEHARDLYERAVGLWEASLGGDHPLVAELLSELAAWLGDHQVAGK